MVYCYNIIHLFYIFNFPFNIASFAEICELPAAMKASKGKLKSNDWNGFGVVSLAANTKKPIQWMVFCLLLVMLPHGIAIPPLLAGNASKANIYVLFLISNSIIAHVADGAMEWMNCRNAMNEWSEQCASITQQLFCGHCKQLAKQKQLKQQNTQPQEAKIKLQAQRAAQANPQMASQSMKLPTLKWRQLNWCGNAAGKPFINWQFANCSNWLNGTTKAR